jgi:hypothetical protein
LTFAFLQDIQARVIGDAVKPCAQLAFSFELFHPSQCFHENILADFFCIHAVLEHAIALRIDHILELLDKAQHTFLILFKDALNHSTFIT